MIGVHHCRDCFVLEQEEMRAYLIYVEGISVTELAELSLGPQQFGLNFCIHVVQKVVHVND